MKQQYVALNVETGEFTNSSVLSEDDVESWLKFNKNDNIKLIKYECINDKDFHFINKMRLR